jgi:hypothetical protein
MGIPDHTNDRLLLHTSFQRFSACQKVIMPAAPRQINVLWCASNNLQLCSLLNPRLHGAIEVGRKHGFSALHPVLRGTPRLPRSSPAIVAP